MEELLSKMKRSSPEAFKRHLITLRNDEGPLSS